MSSAASQLHCAECEAPISVALAEIPGPCHLIREVAGWPLVPPGYFYRATEQGISFAAFAGEFVVNRHSLRDVVETGVRDDGCCGPGGRSGFNLSCRRGHQIGTEIGYCDSVGGVHLPQDRVRLRAACAGAEQYRLLTFAPNGPVNDAATFARWLCAAEQLPATHADDLDQLLDTWRRCAAQPTIVDWQGGEGSDPAWATLHSAFQRHEPFFYLFW
jgi:hypothetical protein